MKIIGEVETEGSQNAVIFTTANVKISCVGYKYFILCKEGWRAGSSVNLIGDFQL